MKPLLGTILVSSALALNARAGGLPKTGALVYSDQCWEAESGDATGHAVRILRTAHGDEIIFEWGEEGGVDATKTAGAVIKDGHIGFTVPRIKDTIFDGPPHRFVGVISDSVVKIRGRADLSGSKDMVLDLPRRKPGFRPKACRAAKPGG